MLKSKGIDHLNLQVKNLDESCRFWEQLLGFRVLEDMPDVKGKIVGDESSKLALYENPNLEKQGKLGFAHMGFHIENFEKCESHCKKLGIAIKYNGAVNWPHSKSIYIEDPNGYEIELAEVWGGGL
ncbi:MAG: VOC family protein [Chthoniobacterales bacterium]